MNWPDTLTVAPIREWPDELTRERRTSAFRSPSRYETVNGERKWKPSAPVPLSQTLRELDRELDAVHARDPELLVAIDAAQFRRDGRPYAMPIDFQVQQQSAANALHRGARNPLGLRTLDNYRGDARVPVGDGEQR